MEREAVLGKITLENVGFDLNQEAAYHSRLLQRGANVKARVFEMARSLRSYESESLEDNVFSFYPYYIHEMGGKKRIFSADTPHPDFLAINQIDLDERQGAVYQGFSKIEERVGELKGKGSFLWVSTDGDAGFRGIKYRYHQVYIGEVEGNLINTVALKSDLAPEILAEWLKVVSKGEVRLKDLSSHSFVRSPVVMEGEGGRQKTLIQLRDLMKSRGESNFYKRNSIDKVIDQGKKEEMLQQIQVREVARDLMPHVNLRKLDPRSMLTLIGNKLHGLYAKYKNDMGDIILTGCAGGRISINELFSKQGNFGLPVLSTAFRAVGELFPKSEDSEDYSFDHRGECVVCHSDPALLGPCDICVSCDEKMGGKAAKKAA